MGSLLRGASFFCSFVFDKPHTKDYSLVMKVILKSRYFTKWANKAGCSDEVLLRAVHEMEQGLIDADLGAHVFKKRVPMQGRGKRGGSRTIVVTNKDDRWIFLFGFAKNVRDTLSPAELETARVLAGHLLALSGEDIANLIRLQKYEEVQHD